MVVGTELTVTSDVAAGTAPTAGHKVLYATATVTTPKTVPGSTAYIAADAGATPPVAEAAATATYEMTAEDVTFTVGADNP